MSEYLFVGINKLPYSAKYTIKRTLESSPSWAVSRGIKWCKSSVSGLRMKIWEQRTNKEWTTENWEWISENKEMRTKNKQRRDNKELRENNWEQRIYNKELKRKNEELRTETWEMRTGFWGKWEVWEVGNLYSNSF